LTLKSGVNYNDNGIEVTMVAAAPGNIYACGDVAGPYRFSHMRNIKRTRLLQRILP